MSVAKQLISLVLTAVCCIASLAVSAREYPMLHYTIEDGLPSNTIYNLYEDEDGVIWIGTDKGVARYNGVAFETFTTADGLSDNECFFFQPDYNGRLWIGTYNGTLCFYKDGTFHNATNTPYLKLPAKVSITVCITINKDSSVTIVFQDKPSFVELNKNKISYYSVKPPSDSGSILDVHEVKKLGPNEYKVFFQYAPAYFNRLTKKFTIAAYPVRFKQYLNISQQQFLVLDNNDVLDEELNKIYSNPLLQKIDAHILRIFIRNRDTIIGTDKGLFIGRNLHLLPDEEIHSIIRDRNGDYWISTRKHGIYRLSRRFRELTLLRNAYSNPVVFASSYRNYFFFSTQNRNTYRIPKNDTLKECIFNYEGRDKKANEQVFTSWIDGDNCYSFSYTNLFRISGITGEKPLVEKLKLFRLRNLWGVKRAFVTDSLVYMQIRNSILMARRKELTGRQTNISLADTSLEQGIRNYGAAQDKDNFLWMSSIKDLYRFEGKNPFLQKQFHGVGFREFIFCNGYLAGISHNNELILTKNYQSNKISFDTLKTGDCVWDKFYKVNDNTLLISTNNYFRILTLNNDGWEIRLLELPFIPFQPEFTYIDSTTCYFFKNNALSSFPISFILEEAPMPYLKFQNLKTDKKSYWIKDVIRLNYAESRRISILFTPLNFNYGSLAYEYSISEQGKADTWISFKGAELNLYKLGFGSYQIKLRGKTLSGKYTQPIFFTLIIAKPFWATWWFICFCGVILIVIIAYIARIGIKRSLKKKEGEVRFLRSEYKALNALMNPHFIFNSLNSVQSLINNNENTVASKYIRIFSDLIRQNMRNIAQDMISLEREMALVTNYLKIEQLRFKDKLQYVIDIEEQVETELIMIPPLLIQPLVENAIKHGIWPKKENNGKIDIRIYERDDTLFIDIIDNGVGIQKRTSDTLHESYALQNIHKRIEQLSVIHQISIKVSIEEIKDADGMVSGTRASISVVSALPK